jgi:drug/metabolite transporter (DMT)-like permease
MSGSNDILAARAATAFGFGAVLLWGTLASLTALKGAAIPPFATTAITFAIGGITIAVIALSSGRARAMKPTPASFALGVYGLFGFHVLYFAALRLAPTAEAGLIASLWALLTVLFSGLLPGHFLHLRHIAGAILGLLAATLLVWNKIGGTSDFPHSHLGFALAFACALVWASYSVLSRLVATVPSESLALPCFATSLLALACSLAFESWTLPQSVMQWGALIGLGLGPVGAAFLLWDIGMKHGNVAYLGVLGYVTPIISTCLLILLGLAAPSLSLAAACALILFAAWLAAPTRESKT